MVKIGLDLIKAILKAIEKTYGMDIVIIIFILIELTTAIIVLWETFTGKSIVDVIWDIIFKEDDENEQ